ncbi:MAG: HAD-IIIA family hydrolase [Gammaproteobacteria bacterium]|nr:HAD-IIIA family hydrolase [Gammaproteobacteria bacterium]
MSQVWPLPFSLPEDVIEKARAVKLVVFDVDGVLTDGSVTYGPDGGEYQTFNIRDGQGIKSLQDNDVVVAILSARSSRALTIRARELGINHVETGAADKTRVFRSLVKNCALDESQCCFVGDDLVDIPVLLRCGLGVAVADAHHTVRHVAGWVTPSGGGRGAAREVCDAVLYAQEKFDAIMDQFTTLSPAP